MKILAIGAHPDDIEFGCGGILYKLFKDKHKINLLVMTKGRVGGDSDERWLEQKKSASLIKAPLFYGGFKDTDVAMGRELIQAIEKVLDKVKPDIVFVNYLEDTHQDHRNLAQAVETASRYMKNVLFYEVPTTLNFLPSVFFDIGPVMKKKEQLLKSHKSQVYKTRVKNLSIIESAKSAAIFRGYQNRVKYAEAFVPQRLSMELLLKK
ncbi:MAG: PIG-L deacetylase family protein [Elusimicrobiota bacterium]|nr:PIG-L deacetylase family protein [Elusimicrobiota bacterium]